MTRFRALDSAFLRPGWLTAILGTAAVLAACAFVVRRQTEKAEHDFPPKGRFIDVDGVRLHYLEYGQADAAQTVVLLHGNGTMGAEFDIAGLAEQAAQRYRVIAFDRPGYGYSERPHDRPWRPQEQADLIDTALRQLGVHDAVVLGHSWGANVALAMGIRHPQNVGALVLGSGYYSPSVRFDVPLLSAPALPLIGPLMRHTISPLLGRFLWPLMSRRLFAPASPTLAFKQRYPVWMSLRPSQLLASAVESARMIPAAISLRRYHSEMSVPTVVIAGASDRLLMTRWNSSRLSERLPQAWLRIVEGSGHMVHHTAPHQVMAAIHQAAGMVRPKAAELQPVEEVTTSLTLSGNSSDASRRLVPEHAFLQATGSHR
jgi:pimeloyl-ACP methyl ester carboxylesterase